MGRSAARPWRDDRPPHLPVARGALPPRVLLPGDPARVDLCASVLDDFEVLGQNREFRVGVGTMRGVPVGVCSTGIGGPSTEIAVVELAGLGVTTVVRTGGMGALRADLTPGTLGTVTSTSREGGAARMYLAPDLPATPAPAVLDALRRAAADCVQRPGAGGADRPSADVTVLSADAYYLGQGRPLPGHEDTAARRFAELAASGVDGVDMEAETVLAVAGAVGLAAGALLVVHANRATDAWLEDYEPAQRDLVRVAAEALVSLDA